LCGDPVWNCLSVNPDEKITETAAPPE